MTISVADTIENATIENDTTNHDFSSNPGDRT